MKRTAFSLAETIVGLGLLGLLLGVAFLCFERGARAWRASDARRDMVNGARVFIANLEREVQRGSYASCATSPEGIAFLSAVNAAGKFETSPHGRPLWRQYLIYYVDSERRLYRREQTLPATVEDPQQLTSLATYFEGGTLLLRDVEQWQIAMDSASQRLDYTLRCRRDAQPQPLRFTLQGSCRFRNL